MSDSAKLLVQVLVSRHSSQLKRGLALDAAVFDSGLPQVPSGSGLHLSFTLKNARKSTVSQQK